MITFERKPIVLRANGFCNSTLYNQINDGLYTPPCKIGPRSVAWPSNEVESLIKARIAGKSPDEIRLLVKVLIAKRTEGVA